MRPLAAGPIPAPLSSPQLARVPRDGRGVLFEDWPANHDEGGPFAVGLLSPLARTLSGHAIIFP
jgi:hypothetical protein